MGGISRRMRRPAHGTVHPTFLFHGVAPQAAALRCVAGAARRRPFLKAGL